MSSDSSTQHCLKKHYTTAKLLTESGTCLLMFSSLSANQIKMFRKLSAKSFRLIIAFEAHHYGQCIEREPAWTNTMPTANKDVSMEHQYTCSGQENTYKQNIQVQEIITDLKWKLKYQSLRQTAGWGQY